MTFAFVFREYSTDVQYVKEKMPHPKIAFCMQSTSIFAGTAKKITHLGNGLFG
jgi:hypothetical protein